MIRLTPRKTKALRVAGLAGLAALTGGVPAGIMLGHFAVSGMAVLASPTLGDPPRLYADNDPAAPDVAGRTLVRLVSSDVPPALPSAISD